MLIAEILSPSTEAFCRGEKFARYRSIPSLVCYLLIAQDRVRIERFLRAEPSEASEPQPWWRYQAFESLDHRVELQPLGCTLALSDVYRRTGLAHHSRAGARYPQHDLVGTVEAHGDLTGPVVPPDDWESDRGNL